MGKRELIQWQLMGSGKVSRTAMAHGKGFGRGTVAGMSRLSILALLLVGYVLYALAFKTGGKAVNHEAATAAPAVPIPLTLVIYTKPSCEPCDRAKAWMSQNHLAFEERDVESSPSYQEDLKNYKSRIVPVILVNGEPQYGFEQAYLEDAVDKVRNPGRK